jgi:hypothetical protein
MLCNSWRFALAGPLLFLGVMLSTASTAKCLPGYESLCSELESPVENGGVGSEAGTGSLSQRPRNTTLEENSDFNITRHGSEVWKRGTLNSVR